MVSIVFVVLAATCNVFMDLSSEGFFKDKRLNKNDTWKNKWKEGDREKGEAFLFSSTLLVFLTDFWHFMQSLMLKFLFLGIVTYRPIILPLLNYSAWWLDVTIYSIVWGFVFQLGYNLLKYRYVIKIRQ